MLEITSKIIIPLSILIQNGGKRLNNLFTHFYLYMYLRICLILLLQIAGDISVLSFFFCFCIYLKHKPETF